MLICLRYYPPIITIVNSVIKSPEVEMTMKEVDRKFYSSQNPYMDAPQGTRLTKNLNVVGQLTDCSTSTQALAIM